MDRSTIIEGIRSRWTALGIPFRIGDGADLAVEATFLDAEWGSGSRKIAYEASVLVDDRDRTVTLFEKTTETGGGFSFGGSSESAFQSGTSLFRKVRSVQYGTDGKAYEVSLDLGAIPKAVKETAKAAGYGFRTALNRQKARYPEGHEPPRPPAAPPQAPPRPAPAAGSVAARFCMSCGAPVTPGDRFCRACGARIH
jgi:hypothetical protein